MSTTHRMENRRRALWLLVVFGSILAMIATWDLPDELQAK
jgi:hypothetical protein